MPRTLSPSEIEAFRERLCDVAEQLFISHGPEGVTMRQLAKALGVSSMTPYRYFADKDAILAAVRRRAFIRFADTMEAAAARDEAAQQPPGSAYLDFARANPSAYRMMFDVYQPNYQAYPELIEAMERARATMALALRRRSGSAFPPTMDANKIAHVFWSALHGAVMLELAGLLRPPLDARQLVEPTLKALAAHIFAPPPATGQGAPAQPVAKPAQQPKPVS